MTKYEIIDSKGVIHDFEDVLEADRAWEAMVLSPAELEQIHGVEHAKKLSDKYTTKWTGDLKLVQIHRIYR